MITFDADDPRTIKALEIAAEAEHWLSGRNFSGEDVYGVPSQHDPNRYYIVTHATCDCPAFARRAASAQSAGNDPENNASSACKHILAVRLHRELVRAQRHQPAPKPTRRRGHLAVVS